jgi:hypothetical protein
MVFVGRDVDFTTDDFSSSLARPELPTDTMPGRPVGQQRGSPGFLFPRQLRDRSPTGPGRHPGFPFLRDTLHPLADCSFCNPQHLRHFLVGPAVTL